VATLEDRIRENGEGIRWRDHRHGELAEEGARQKRNREAPLSGISTIRLPQPALPRASAHDLMFEFAPFVDGMVMLSYVPQVQKGGRADRPGIYRSACWLRSRSVRPTGSSMACFVAIG
jgi:hypothetical protein